MKVLKVKGATSQILEIFILDSSSTTGAGLTGLTQASAGLTCYYHRNTAVAAVVVTLVTMTVGTFTSSGFKEIDATNMPGWYQLCLPNAAYATGADSVSAHLKGATNMAPLPLEIQLTGAGFDPASAVAAATPAEVKTQMTDALNVDTYAEPGQVAPAATTTLVTKLGFLYKAWRNRSTQTSTTYSLDNDDAATVDQKATVSDDGTTFVRGEVATGP